jgi:hypothetical protein
MTNPASTKKGATPTAKKAQEITRRTTRDGRIVYDDVLSVIRSKEAVEHFRKLNDLVRKGFIPRLTSTSGE